MKIFSKIQKLPETKRKIILWATVIIFSLVLFFFWTRLFQKRLQGLKSEEMKERFNFPQTKMPEFELPALSEEDLEEIERMIREAEEKTAQ